MGKYYIIKLLEKGADEKKFKEEKIKLKEELLKIKQDKAINDWFEAVRKKAKITNYIKPQGGNK